MTEADIPSVVGASRINSDGDQRRGEATTKHRASPLGGSAAAPDLRVWLGGFGGFAVLAVIGLLLPIGPLGWRVLALVVVFHIGTVVLARRTGDASLWSAWTVLAPLSVLMVLPDWFLSAELGTLTFADTAAPFIDTVPLFMAGMWTIALLPVVFVGLMVSSRRSVRTGALAAAAAGFVMFWGAELFAPAIPLWEPVGVAMIGGIATYVIVPEIVLSLCAYLLVATRGMLPVSATTLGIVLLPFTYTGMLATSYQFLG